MTRIRFVALFTASLAGACATTPAADPAPVACVSPAVGNPPAHLARDGAGATPRPTVRNPAATVVRGLVADRGGGDRVEDPGDPALARSARSSSCALTLAHASR